MHRTYITALATALIGLALAAGGCSKPASDPYFKATTPAGAAGAGADTTVSGSPAATSGTPHAEVPGDIDARVARIERRLDKVIDMLERVMPPADPDPALAYAVPIDPADPIEGPADAKITVVEAYEFACPFCWKAHPTVKQLLVDYPKDVRVVSKYLVIHDVAVPSGLAACAANKQGKYVAYREAMWSRVFSPDGKVQQENLNPENLEKLATELGLDVTKFKSDMRSPDCQGWLQKSAQLLSAVGTNATPSFYVNGRHVSGAAPIEQFKALITEELAKADKAIAGGVAQASYYDSVVKSGEKRVKGHFED